MLNNNVYKQKKLRINKVKHEQYYFCCYLDK